MLKMPSIYGIGSSVLTHLRPSMISSLQRNASVTQTNKLVVVDKFKAVTILSINRPEKQNAMNEALLLELATQLKHFEEDNSSSIAIINGIGGNFSAGYDIDELMHKSQHDMNSVRNSLVLPFQRKTAKPLVCSISGLCKAIGFEIALMCDIRYAEKKSCFSFNNRQLGIPLLNDGPNKLAKLIGSSKAIEFLISDKQISSCEAADLGIVSNIVQDATGLGSALKTAVCLSSFPQAALQHDLNAMNGMNLNVDEWTSILTDIKSNINLEQESLKSARKSKLNNMPEWELKEIEHEKNYAKSKQNQMD